MYPYTTIDPQAFANEQAMLQQRINQLEQARNQQMSMYAPQSQQQPQAAVEQMAQTNPNVKKAMDMCKGKNPKQVFEDMCRQNGMDPGQFSGLMK